MIKPVDGSSLFVRVSLCPAEEFQSVRDLTRSVSDANTSPLRVIKQSQSFAALRAHSQSQHNLGQTESTLSPSTAVQSLPAECGVIKGIPPLNPVKGKLHFKPTPLAVKSAVALRAAGSNSRNGNETSADTNHTHNTTMDYRKFNIYGQRSLDGIPSAPEPELDSFEVLTRSVSRSLSLGGGHHQHSTPQSGTKRSGSRDPISNLRAAGKVSSGRSSNLATWYSL